VLLRARQQQDAAVRGAAAQPEAAAAAEREAQHALPAARRAEPEVRGRDQHPAEPTERAPVLQGEPGGAQAPRAQDPERRLRPPHARGGPELTRPQAHVRVRHRARGRLLGHLQHLPATKLNSEAD